MKYKYNNEWKDLTVKAGDTLPIGTIVEYDGNTVPSGYEEVNSYSTDEVKTGDTWIDGKPIYRKVVTKTLNGNADQTVDLGIATVLRNLVKFEGYIYKSVQGYRPLNSTYFSSLNYAVQTFINDNKILQIQAGSSARDILNGATLYLIIEYTKTTD